MNSRSRSTPRVIVPRPGGSRVDPLQASPAVRRPVALEGEKPRPWEPARSPAPVKAVKHEPPHPTPTWPSPVRSVGGGPMRPEHPFTPPWVPHYHRKAAPHENHRTPAWKESPVHELMTAMARLGGEAGEIGQGSPFLGEPKTYSAFEE